MSNQVKRIWNTFTSLLVVIVISVALLLAGVRLVGLQPYTVLSGSMEPTYHVGSMIYVRKVNYTSLKVGDSITFLLDENTVATHRIIEIIPDAEDPTVLRFRTKGDANSTDDGDLGVHCRNVIGKPVFSIPYLGYVAEYIQNKPGKYVTICACCILVILVFLPDLFAKPEESSDEEEDKTL